MRSHNNNVDSSIVYNVFNGKYNSFIVIFLAMAYATSKLICNLMFLRPVNVSLVFFPNDLLIPAATFLYPIIYVINICIMMLSNKRIAIIVAFVGILCDGIFSFGSGSIVRLPVPHHMTASELKNTLSINLIGGYMWDFYLKGIIISIVVAILSLELFIWLDRAKVIFSINMLISTYIPTIIHHMQMISQKTSINNTVSIFEEYSLLYLSALIVYTMIVSTIKQLQKEIIK